jgi:hypothetical protein
VFQRRVSIRYAVEYENAYGKSSIQSPRNKQIAALGIEAFVAIDSVGEVAREYRMPDKAKVDE